jgi:hypothetical protein
MAFIIDGRHLLGIINPWAELSPVPPLLETEIVEIPGEDGRTEGDWISSESNDNADEVIFCIGSEVLPVEEIYNMIIGTNNTKCRAIARHSTTGRPVSRVMLPSVLSSRVPRGA